MTKRLYRLQGDYLPGADGVRSILLKEALIRRGSSDTPSVMDGLIGASAPDSYASYSCNCSDSAMGSFYITFSQVPYSSVSTFYEDDSAVHTMFASEAVLSREWDSPEEDAAWAHL